MVKERIQIIKTDNQTVIHLRPNWVIAGFTMILALMFTYIYLMMLSYMPLWGKLLAGAFVLIWGYLTALLVVNKRTISISQLDVSRERGPLPSWSSSMSVPTTAILDVKLDHQVINVNANQKSSSYFILLEVEGMDKPQMLDRFSSGEQANEIVELIEEQRQWLV